MDLRGGKTAYLCATLHKVRDDVTCVHIDGDERGQDAAVQPRQLSPDKAGELCKLLDVLLRGIGSRVGGRWTTASCVFESSSCTKLLTLRFSHSVIPQAWLLMLDLPAVPLPEESQRESHSQRSRTPYTAAPHPVHHTLLAAHSTTQPYICPAWQSRETAREAYIHTRL